MRKWPSNGLNNGPSKADMRVTLEQSVQNTAVLTPAPIPVVRVERLDADEYWRDIIAKKDGEIRKLRIDNARLRDEAATRSIRRS